MHFRHRQTDRRTDGLASWHKREMYILHLVLKTQPVSLISPARRTATQRTGSGVNEP